MNRLAPLACLICCSLIHLSPASAATPEPTPVGASTGKTRQQVIQDIEARIRRQSQQEIERQKNNPQAAQEAQPQPQGVPAANAPRVRHPRIPGQPPQPQAQPNGINASPAQQPSNSITMPSSNEIVLMIDPPSATAHVGEALLTSVTASCMKQREFDKVDVRLSYDPSKIKPTAVHYHELKELVDGEPEFSVNSSAGKIRFAATLKNPLPFTSKQIISVVWMPLRETDVASVNLSWPDQRSSLQLNEKDLLSSNLLEKACLLPLDLTIKEMPAQSFKTRQEKDQGVIENPSLWLDVDGPLGPFEKDEEFDIHIYLRNPQRTGFDTVSLVLQYDPKKVRVLDWDKGNWIRTGTNIRDGNHKQFPFNFFRKNEVDQQSGRIVYQMGSVGANLDADGLLAEIRAQAISPEASVEDFAFVFEAEDGVATEISGGGTPLLGKVE